MCEEIPEYSSDEFKAPAFYKFDETQQTQKPICYDIVSALTTLDSSKSNSSAIQPNTILAFSGINWNVIGSSVRTERADGYGYFRPFSDDSKYGTGFIVQAGATHDWGGMPNFGYSIDAEYGFTNRHIPLSIRKTLHVNPAYANLWDSRVRELGKWNELAPCHNEWYLSRAGCHIVYSVGFMDSEGMMKLPEYLKNRIFSFRLAV